MPSQTKHATKAAPWNPLELHGLESACFSLAYERIPKRLLPKGKKGPSALVAALAETLGQLTQRFNHGERKGKSDYLSNDAILYAYSLQFLPLNSLRVQWVLSESLRTGWQAKPNNILRILDLGSGPGSAALAAINMVRHHPAFSKVTELDIVTVDRSRKALTVGKELADRIHGEQTPKRNWTGITHDFHRSLLPKGPLFDEPFDLIFCANLINELPFTALKRQRFAKECADQLTPSGLLVFVEPATMEETRNLIALRASLRKLHSIAPCPNQAPCPYHAERPQDWCHTSVPLPSWPWLERLDHHTGLDHTSLTFSYWTGSPQPPADHEKTARPIRVISDMLRSSNRYFRWVCKPEGVNKETPRRILSTEPILNEEGTHPIPPHRGQRIFFGTFVETPSEETPKKSRRTPYKTDEKPWRSTNKQTDEKPRRSTNKQADEKPRRSTNKQADEKPRRSTNKQTDEKPRRSTNKRTDEKPRRSTDKRTDGKPQSSRPSKPPKRSPSKRSSTPKGRSTKK